MTMFCDLHMHSTASDGTVPPEQLPAEAKRAGLSAIALTDHDTTEGLAACAVAAADAGVTFVPGIEVSADPGSVTPPRPNPDEPRRGTLHILGLFINPQTPALISIQQRMRDARDERNPAIVAKLRDLGVMIDYEEVRQLARDQGGNGEATIGRPHIAQVLVRKNYVKSVQDAFSRYLAQGKPAYVRRDRLDAGDAIQAIHAAGGLAVLAHPVQLGLIEAGELEWTVRKLADLGLDALEAYHPDHTPAMTRTYLRLAERNQLMISGGSDFHGLAKPILLGSQSVPWTVYQTMDEASRRSVPQPTS